MTPHANCTISTFIGTGTDCDPNPCPTLGACCFTAICFLVTEETCFDNSGEFLGDGTICSPGFCGLAGACCMETGQCLVTSEQQCAISGGTMFLGDDCSPNFCDIPTAACCFADSTCAALPGVDCAESGGMFLVEAASCDPLPCVVADAPTPVVEWSDRILVFPNPARDRISVMLRTTGSERIQVDLVDVTGRVVRSRPEMTATGPLEVRLEVNDVTGRLPAGTYYVRARVGRETTTRSVVIVP